MKHDKIVLIITVKRADIVRGLELGMDIDGPLRPKSFMAGV